MHRIETIEDFQAFARRLGVVREMRWERANRACREAGLGSISCALHNCFIGDPWPEVDYRKARLARYLLASNYHGDLEDRAYALYCLRGASLTPGCPSHRHATEKLAKLRAAKPRPAFSVRQ